jgi:DNA-binding NtrC family response regulator
MPELLLLSGNVPVVRAPLHGQVVTVGRSPANDISLPDDDLPPFLCSFEPLGDGKYRVVDRSGRGVQMNGKVIHDDHVGDGAVFQFGRLQARFALGLEDKEPLKPGGQRTGLLRTRTDGTLLRTDIRLRLPQSLGGKRIEVPAEGLRVGSLADNDIVVDDGFVSSFHAQLFLRGERLFVRDLDSTNGTFIGAGDGKGAGLRVVEAEVPVGATIRFGKAEVVVEGDEAEVEVDAGSGKGPWRCAELHTADPGFARTFALIEKVAPHDASVCVFGETGTGKELAAHALHTLSGRRHGPFVALNCAAFPEELIESELFGHEKGAFTGADRQRKGCFEEADKGTLFLDEIGELPLEMQAKLLRVLETRAVRRLGGRGDIAVDVRIVCATHRDLVKHVREGRFREDLLHRIYVIPVKLPALRERTADILHLARLFAEKLAPGAALQGRAGTGKVKLTSSAEQALMSHPFPGNVRELRNVIQRALILGDGKTITDGDVAFIPVSLAEAQDQGALYKKGMTMDDVEKAAIESALQAFGSLGEAAKSLGVAKTTFWRKAKQFGFTKEEKPEGP